MKTTTANNKHKQALELFNSIEGADSLLSAREKDIIFERASGKTFNAISEGLGISNSRVVVLYYRSIRKLREQKEHIRHEAIRRGILIKTLTPLKETGADFKEVTLEDSNLSFRTYNALRRAGIKTLYQFVMLDADQIMRVRNLARSGVDEALTRAKELFDGLYIPKPFSKEDEELFKMLSEKMKKQVKEKPVKQKSKRIDFDLAFETEKVTLNYTYTKPRQVDRDNGTKETTLKEIFKHLALYILNSSEDADIYGDEFKNILTRMIGQKGCELIASDFFLERILNQFIALGLMGKKKSRYADILNDDENQLVYFLSAEGEKLGFELNLFKKGEDIAE